MTESLIEAARGVVSHSYSPYSNFSVGAAIEWSNGVVTTGVNVENKSYGLTQCAERSAVTAGISSGCNEIVAVAIWVDCEEPVCPCGACRQVLQEFSEPSGSLQIVVACPGGKDIFFLKDLLPHPF